GLFNRSEGGQQLFNPENERILALNGILIDEIENVGPSITPENLETDAWLSTIKQWESMMLGLCKSLDLTKRIPGSRDNLPASLAAIKYEEDHGMPLGEAYYATIVFLSTILKGFVRGHLDKEEAIPVLSPSGSELRPTAASLQNLTSRQVLHASTIIDTIYFEQYQIWLGRLSPADATTSHLAHLIPHIGVQLKAEVRGWKFCVTKYLGLPALVPWNAEKEDAVCILFGADVPLILRKIGQMEDHFKRIGTAYVNCVMQGEMIPYYEEGKLQKRTFHLV
ncbi:MAG: hypothetical protein M1839_006306, partial [Geoglossum umbratile]